MKTYKAYKVDCDDPDHGATIEFAFRAKDVDRNANSETCDCEYVRKHVRRAPEFDKYAHRKLTIADYLAEGWYWPCHHCERQLFKSPPAIIVADAYVFCDLTCLRNCRESWPKIPAGHHDSVLRLCVELDAYLDGLGSTGEGAAG